MTKFNGNDKMQWQNAMTKCNGNGKIQWQYQNAMVMTKCNGNIKIQWQNSGFQPSASKF